MDAVAALPTGRLETNVARMLPVLPRALLALAAILIPTCGSGVSAATTSAPDKFVRAFSTPDGGPAAVSPDGKQLAYIAREKRQAWVHIVPIADAKAGFRVAVGKEKRADTIGLSAQTDLNEVSDLHWASNDHVVLGSTFDDFMAVNARDRSSRYLADLEGLRYGRMVGLIPGEPPHVVIEAAGYAAGTSEVSYLVLKVNVATGAFESTRENVSERLLYDGRGVIRGRMGLPTQPAYLRKPEGGKNPWVRLPTAYPALKRPFPLAPEACFGERTFPVALTETEAFFASNVGRDTYGIYSFDLRKGERTPLALEDPGADLVPFRGVWDGLRLVWDRAREKVLGVPVLGVGSPIRWIDEELAKVQQNLETKLRVSMVRLVDWDDARERFVVELHKRGDPGGFYLYTASRDTLQLIVAKNTAAQALPRTVTSAWSLPQPGGGQLSGFLVVPTEPSPAPRPIVVRFGSTVWSPVENYYRAEVMALAQMGYAVLEVNHRGLTGFGRAHLQAGRHQADEVAAEDVVKAIDGVAAAANLDARRVAVFGELYGGYLALRALQLQPGRFVCGVTLDPYTDLVPWLELKSDLAYSKFEHGLRAWFFGEEKAALRAHSPETNPKGVRVPLFLSGDSERRSYNWGDVRSFRRALIAAGNPPVFVEGIDHSSVPLQERAQLWGRIEDFLRQHLAAK
jgi:dienelactone hydrolase